MAAAAEPDDGAAPTPESLAPHFPAYEIQTLIGRGGMGAVYRAVHRKLGRPVALKILATERGADPEFAERFFREARVLARLRHPGIVYLHDFGEVDGLLYLAMEYVDGGNLRDRMRGGRLRAAEARQVLCEVGEALAYAHQEGVVHRDVKPENVLIDREGRVRLADFGLVKLLARSERLTETQQSLGTPYYMAPEQLSRPAAVDARADLYSFGVLAYEMLTGELPVGDFPPASATPDVPAQFDGVIRRCLQHDPEKRWESMSAILGVLAQREVATAPSTQREPVRRADSVFKPMMALSALALLLCFAPWYGVRTSTTGAESLPDFRGRDGLTAFQRAWTSASGPVLHVRGVDSALDLWFIRLPGWSVAAAACLVALLMIVPRHVASGITLRHQLWAAGTTFAVLLLTVTSTTVIPHRFGAMRIDVTVRPGVILELATWFLMLLLLLLGGRPRRSRRAAISKRFRYKRQHEGRAARKRRHEGRFRT